MTRALPAVGSLQRCVVVCNSARRVAMLGPTAQCNNGRGGCISKGSGRRGSIFSSKSLSTEAGSAPTRASISAVSKENPKVQRPVKDVVVVGAGVAGLASAACLGRIGLRVTIAEIRGGKSWKSRAQGAKVAEGVREERAGKEKEAGSSLAGEGGIASTGRSALDPGVGIWTHGLSCLAELGILEQLEAEGRYMGEAGYRSTNGNWLAAPAQPLQEYSSCDESGAKGGASVLFVRESKLIEALHSALPHGTRFIEACVEDIGNGAGGDPGRESSGSSTSRGTAIGRLSTAMTTDNDAAVTRDTCMADNGRGVSSSRWSQEFDLLVGADGPDSVVRNRFMRMSDGPGPATATTPQRQGYAVYRGVCSRDSSSSAAAGGVGGEEDWRLGSFQTWGPGRRFASVPLAKDERMWFATIADGVVGDKERGGGRSLIEEQASSRPEEIKSFLLSQFSTWHDPIADLLHATEAECIARQDAMAMSRRGLQAVTVATAASRKLVEGVVLVGDAAHMLDPVLAQGAGVALEDAFFLARRIKDFNSSFSPATAAEKRKRSLEHGLGDTLSRYDAERLQRVLVLSSLSDLSQTLGHLRQPKWLVSMRDSYLARFVPSGLRSRVFDGLMAASLAGGFAGATRAAMAAASGGRPNGGDYWVPKL